MRLVPQERIPALLQGAHYDPSIPEAAAEACCKLKVSLVVRRGPRNWLGILGAATLKAELLGTSLVF